MQKKVKDLVPGDVVRVGGYFRKVTHTARAGDRETVNVYAGDWAQAFYADADIFVDNTLAYLAEPNVCRFPACGEPADGYKGFDEFCMNHAAMVEDDCRREHEWEMEMFRQGRL